MTGLDDDRELEDFLARRSSLHQRLADRDRTEAPPPELDRLVMSHAREAIEVPAPLPVYRAPRWALPVGLVATVLLTFAVVLNLGRVAPKGVQPLSPASPQAQARATAEPARKALTLPEVPAPKPDAAAAHAPIAAADKPNHADPRAWLQEIERLRVAGKTEEADRELASFRRSFPGHTAPAATTARPPTQ